MVVDAPELRATVVHVIRSLTEVKIHDIHRIHLTNLFIHITFGDVFRYGFRYAIEHPQEIIQLPVILHFNNNQFAFTVFCQQVHTVEFVGNVLFVSFALENLTNGNLFLKQAAEEAFEHNEVAFMSEQAFHGPVKTYKMW